MKDEAMREYIYDIVHDRGRYITEDILKAIKTDIHKFKTKMWRLNAIYSAILIALLFIVFHFTLERQMWNNIPVVIGYLFICRKMKVMSGYKVFYNDIINKINLLQKNF